MSDTESDRSTIPLRPAYDPAKFVGRERELKEARNWITSPRPDDVVLVIHGAPGTGKSWFLRKLCEDPVFAPNPAPTPLHRLDVIELIPEGLRLINGCALDAGRSEKWISHFIDHLRAQEGVAGLAPYDPVVQFEQVVRNVAQALADHHQPKKVYIVIDNGDLLIENEWHLLEQRVIRPMYGEAPAAFRFLLALRNPAQVWLTDAAMNQTVLLIQAGAGFGAGEEQLFRLIQDQPKLTVDRVKALLPAYDWTHPTLNSFLFDEAVRWGTEQEAIDHSECLNMGLNALHALPADPAEAQKVLDRILKLATDESERWNVTTMATDIWGESKIHTWDWIDKLQAYGLLVNDEQASSQYKLADGLRSFIRACRQI
jgi:hypothetical protein